MNEAQDNVSAIDGDLQTNTGSLVVFVLDSGGALPVSGATVSIYKSGDLGGTPIAVLKSGENGKTDTLYLPAPERSLMENSQRNEESYSLYDVKVELNGYYDIISRNIPVYSSIMTIQPVYMVPMSLGGNLEKNATPNGGDLPSGQ